MGVFDQGPQRTVLPEPADGSFGAALGDAPDVVGLIADQGQVIADKFRRNPHFCGYARNVEVQIFIGVDHADAAADQLRQVLVVGDDNGLAAVGNGTAGESGDDVIGLKFGIGDDQRHTGGDQELLDAVHLAVQIRRGRRPVCLVVGGEAVAEGRPRRVEDEGEMRRPVVFAEGAQQVDHAVNGRCRLAPGVVHGRQGVVAAEDGGGAVHQIETAIGKVHIHQLLTRGEKRASLFSGQGFEGRQAAAGNVLEKSAAAGGDEGYGAGIGKALDGGHGVTAADD